MSDTYRIVRFFKDAPRTRKHREVVATGRTLAEAQAHCNDPETSSKTATSRKAAWRTGMFGEWFDGYEKET